MIKFLKDQPIAFIEREKILVVSELHLGFEHELMKSGIVIPPQAEKFVKIIRKAMNKTKAKKLLIIGDVKHKVPGISSREIKEIPKFFSRFENPIVVKGNHDANLEKIISAKIHGSKGMRIGKFGFFHGNAWPEREIFKCDYLFASHLHPSIQIVSEFGLKSMHRVWVKTKIDKRIIEKKFGMIKTGKLNLIVMPAFNPLVGHMVLNSPKVKLSSPLKSFLKEAEIYLLDGTFFGKLKF